ncbi:MAG: protein-L-isoaspartate(D-aspartate) O-methyltransferase [Acidobacteriota bacterium]
MGNPVTIRPVSGLAVTCGLLLLAGVACAVAGNGDGSRDQGDDAWAARRRQMVETQIRDRGITDPRVLAAMSKVTRHRFVRERDMSLAYGDFPVEIGLGQTISQPYIVAFMSQALRVGPSDKVLEVGTGSGYQAAILGELAREVYTIEILPALADAASAVLGELGYANVHVRTGDGYAGWPEQAPFDAVMVTAAPDHVPLPLVDQLRDGGRLVIPVGRGTQDLIVYTRTSGGLREEERLPVRFVPLTRKPGSGS